MSSSEKGGRTGSSSKQKDGKQTDLETEPPAPAYEDTTVSFLIGRKRSRSGRRIFRLHTDFIAKQSEILWDLSAPSVQHKHQVRLRDVEPRTFILFVRFATTGVYDDSDVDVLDDETLDSAVIRGIQEDPARTKYCDFDISGFTPSERTPLEYDRPNTMLRYAKAYVFADTYDIPSLRATSITHIKHNLDDDASDIAQLCDVIRYTYSHTQEDREEPLRKTLLWFCCQNILFLQPFPEFTALKAEGGSFAVDLTDGVVEQYERKLEGVEERVIVDLRRCLKEIEELRGEPVPAAYWQLISRVKGVSNLGPS